MDTMIVTTPIRPVPTNYPPIGSLALINYLRKHGHTDVEFYNIDGNRPTYEEALDHIVRAKPRVLGISAVVSTAYAYTKRLSIDVKERLPDTLVVVGGNLAASAEILLKKAGVDLCVVSEGEKILLNVVRRAETTRDPADFADIAGLVLLDRDGALINTGYETSLDATEVDDVDWTDLEKTSNINNFLIPYPSLPDGLKYYFEFDPRSKDPHRKDQTYVDLPSGKGCVAKCTFCHRWDKGMRYIPIETYFKRIDYLMEHYNLGFLSVAGENFGSDKRWAKRFCAEMAKRDLLWIAGAVRTRTVDPGMIDEMKAAGCVSIIYGAESGSPRMLQVMEKKTSIEDNRNALRWTLERGMPSIIQLVIGMPGETPETIGETIDFCKTTLPFMPNQGSNQLSINYAQALPGTPLYEYARHKGLIGRDQDGEEEYLLRISDRDAHDEFTTLNFTDYSALECQAWRPRITIETNFAYVQHFGIVRYHHELMRDAKFFAQERSDTGYFANPKRLVDSSIATDTVHDRRDAYVHAAAKARIPSLWSLIVSGNHGLAMICYPVLFYRLRSLLPMIVWVKNLPRVPLRTSLESLGEYFWSKLTRSRAQKLFNHEYKSLRKIVDNDLGSLPHDLAALAPLRKGR
ncbi:MAG: cobalamin B12-binding domain-containing protein [Woeseiaceae bacterium]|nr:cobalamin B12-binding domain-containing protein [Woeseiaceae bacterium]